MQNGHTVSICFTKIADIVEIFTVFSPISGFIADFHRKSLYTVKQHPNNAIIGLIACFSQVIKARHR